VYVLACDSYVFVLALYSIVCFYLWFLCVCFSTV